MKAIFRNVLAIIAGWVVGSLINMGFVKIGHKLLPLEGVDPNDMAALAEVMPTLDFEYFIFPFLAHALGTLFGAVVAGILAVNQPMRFSLAIGVLFLIGGIMINYMIPGPTWFTLTDILLAYIPMAWIGGRIVENIRSSKKA